MQKLTYKVTPLALCLTLAACGGGGGSDGGSSSGGSVNNPPSASSTAISVKANNSHSGTLPASDPDGDALTYEIALPPSKGSLTSFSTNTGAFTYQPNTGVLPGESDTFSFRVNDGSVDSTAESVTVQIVSPPSAVDDAATVVENSSVTINVLGNDINPLDETVAVEIESDGADGVAVVNGDLTITYTHNGAETPTDVFTYRVVPQSDPATTGDVDVSITPVNDAPVVTSPAMCLPLERSKTAIANVVANDPDSLNLTYRITSNGSKGTAEIPNPSIGIFNYMPNGSDYGLDSFDVLIDDGQGGTVIETVRINIGVKVMPMGDSITTGVTNNGSGISPSKPNRVGYRLELQQILEAAGYSIDFVGSQNVANGSDPNEGYGYSRFSDFQSEGHGGSGALFFRNNTNSPSAWLNNELPEVVLLHTGTNDFTMGTPNPDETDVVETVANILADSDIKHVFVAEIIGQRQPNNADITAGNVINYNSRVVSGVTGRSGLSKVTFVDLYNTLEYDQNDPMTDFDHESTGEVGKHPKQKGYDKMAAEWASEIMANSLFEKCP